MALQAAYKQFLAAPNTSFLADDASLHYITTLISYNTAADIIKHLNNQTHSLKKKTETFLDVVEAENALVVEVETTIDFLTGGGAFLPALDDNFLTDRTVTFPIIHIVSFDGNGKLLQIRQNWDQGSLLKSVEVMGKSGRNWPIKEPKEQVKLIAASVKAAGKGVAEDLVRGQSEDYHRSRQNSTNITRDPHASLALFAPREEVMQSPTPSALGYRASARPPPRDYSELFVGGDNAGAAPTQDPRDRSESPSKFSAGIAPKAGGSKNYQPSRLFETDEQDEPIHHRPVVEKASSTESAYKVHPKKYQHFDFGDGSDLTDVPTPTPAPSQVKSKHGSQWQFDDFNTPAKAIPTKVLGQQVKHWGNEEDEVINSPIKPKRVDRPRKDTETHFEFQDDGTPENAKKITTRPRGTGANNGLGLYKDHILGEEQGVVDAKAHNNPVSIKDRHRDFDPHFAMADEDSPAEARHPEKLSQDKLRAIKMMDANWSAYDTSPSVNQKENKAPGVPPSPTRPTSSKGPLSETTNAVRDRNDNKGIAIGGDGMGGRKGTSRGWGFGNDGDDPMGKPTSLPGRKRGNAQHDSTIWDF